MIRGLDEYITGHYGEDQFRGMRPTDDDRLFHVDVSRDGKAPDIMWVGAPSEEEAVATAQRFGQVIDVVELKDMWDFIDVDEDVDVWSE